MYVNGTIRGTAGNEHYLFPGEYTLHSGSGRLIIQNLCDKAICLKQDSLLTRSYPTTKDLNVCCVSFSQDSPSDTIQCGDKITMEQKLQLQNLLQKFGDCFSSGLKDVGFTNAGEMVIELTDSEPVVYRPYRMSYSEKELVRCMIQEMLDARIVQESTSPYASPIVLVKKNLVKKGCVWTTGPSISARKKTIIPSL